MYGKICSCCGEKISEFLAIDHINGGGSKHRKEFKGSIQYHKWLLALGHRRKGFRTLCHNCNFAEHSVREVVHTVPPKEANIRFMLQELESLGEGLTKWEQQFLEDITDYVDRGGKLSDAQYKTLCDIYVERVK